MQMQLLILLWKDLKMSKNKLAIPDDYFDNKRFYMWLRHIEDKNLFINSFELDHSACNAIEFNVTFTMNDYAYQELLDIMKQKNNEGSEDENN